MNIATMVCSKFLNNMTGLNTHMRDFSYVHGYEPTQGDVRIMEANGVPDNKKFPHAARWFRHVASFSEAERRVWPETCADDAAKPTKGAEKKAEKKVEAEKPKDDEDDFDLFGEQTEEEKAALEKTKESVDNKKKEATKKKKEVIAKSTLVFEIKPMSGDTDLTEVEEKVRSIKMEGLEWSSACKRIPMVFGLFKLQLGAVIIDELIQTEEILERIETLGMTEEQAKLRLARRDGEGDDEGDDESEEDVGIVQSAEIISFQKI